MPEEVIVDLSKGSKSGGDETKASSGAMSKVSSVVSKVKTLKETRPKVFYIGVLALLVVVVGIIIWRTSIVDIEGLKEKIPTGGKSEKIKAKGKKARVDNSDEKKEEIDELIDSINSEQDDIE